MEKHFRGTQSHINIENIKAELAFLPGPPERALAIANIFASYEKVTEQREFVTYKGETERQIVCVTSTGIGCPPAAIVVEELANCGGETFIRVGTTRAIQADIESGDVIILVAAVRADGTTKEYVGDVYPAITSSEIARALKNVAK